MKNYIGISRDHSGSMYLLARSAANDYNNNIEAIKQSSLQEKQDTIVSVVTFGASIQKEVVNSSVNVLKPLMEHNYYTGGGTPLFDSVGELIDLFKKVPDYDDLSVSFLVMAITDGEENASTKYKAANLGAEIRKLQATDRWTFIFRVPRGYTRALTGLGIPEGNIQEWDQTNKGMETSTNVTSQAFKNYYTQRSAGKKSTSNFFETDLSNVSRAEVRSVLKEITNEVDFFKVDSKHDAMQIRDFMEAKTKTSFKKGSAFYELMKTEKAVQDYKIIAIKDKKSAKVYAGSEARTILGLPTSGTVKLVPGDHGNFKIYVQSTSVNRKLLAGTTVMYWKNII